MPEQKDIKEVHTVHSRSAGPQNATCFMLPFWHIEFRVLENM